MGLDTPLKQVRALQVSALAIYRPLMEVRISSLKYRRFRSFTVYELQCFSDLVKIFLHLKRKPTCPVLEVSKELLLKI